MDIHDLYIPEQDWRKLLAAASGDASLLYLYIRAGGQTDQAESALRMSKPRLDCAAACLKQLGLWPEAPRVLRPAEPPVYSEEDLIREQKKNGGFQHLVGETQRRLGKLLSTEELKILLSIYDYLGMPAEVISVLISYCIQRARARGSQRLPSMRIMEREAYHWADLGIDTLEEAAAHMQLQLERQTAVSRIRHTLQLGDRKLTPGEEKMVMQWIDWGFGEPEIALAYEKTCMNTGGLKWPYLNSILKSWHNQGLHSVSAIETGDKAPRNGQVPHPTGQMGQLELEAIKRMMQQQED